LTNALPVSRGYAVAYYATSRNVAGLIPDGAIGILIDITRPHYGPGVNSAPNRIEYQEYFLGVKAADA
jgi:hypothetical protein